jgi:hypothetical protein
MAPKFGSQALSGRLIYPKRLWLNHNAVLLPGVVYAELLAPDIGADKLGVALQVVAFDGQLDVDDDWPVLDGRGLR